MHIRNWLRQRRRVDMRDDRWSAGNATVELALIVPILVALFVGVWDFGRALNQTARLASAAYAGAQYGALSSAHANDTAGIRQAARVDAVDVTGVLEITPISFSQCPSGAQAAFDGTCGAAGEPRLFLRVEVTESFQTLFPYPFVSNPITLRRRAELRVY